MGIAGSFDPYNYNDLITMKHTFTLLLLFLLAGTARAQLQKGDRLHAIGGSNAILPVSSTPLNQGTLGALEYNPYTDRGQFSVGGNLAWMLTDRFAIGTGVAANLYFGQGVGTSASLSPFARYYFLNRPEMMVYGEVGTSATKSLDRYSGASNLNLSAGLQLPVAPGILLSPSLTYAISEGRNFLSMGAGIELILGKNTDTEGQAIANLQRGDLLLGAQSLGVTFGKNVTSLGADFGGYYLLSERFALGANLSVSHTGLGNDGSRGDFSYSAGGIGIGGRYYLTAQAHTVWFVETGASFSWANSKFSNVSESSSQPYLLAGGGAQIFLRDNVSLEVGPQLRYATESGSYSLGGLFGVRFVL